MTSIDFDFGRYIAMRRGEVHQRARDGAAYSFAGERKVRRALGSARPVSMAIGATSRAWKKRGRTDLLAGARRATDEVHPEVYKACSDAARVLAFKEAPPIYVTDHEDFPVSARALGADDDAWLIISSRLLEILEPVELLAVIGHELGHIQNNHLSYATALFYLRHDASMFVRWIVQPAIMTLQAWARRAEITCDRAALLVTRDLDATLRGLVKTALAESGKPPEPAAVDELVGNGAESDRESRGFRRFGDLFSSHPYLPKRIEALRVFSQSMFFQKFSGAEGAGGLRAEDVDTKVSEIVSVF